MLDSMEYTATWGAYLLAAAGILLFWWQVTRIIPWALLRNTLRVLVAVPLLVPAPVTDGQTDWAPALFVLLFDMTLQEVDDPARAMPFLAYGLVIGLVLILVDGAFRFWRSGKQVTPPAQPNS